MSRRSGWRTSETGAVRDFSDYDPAYDLTLSDRLGGQHNLVMAGEGRVPAAAAVAKVAQSASIGRAAAQIEGEVRDAIRD